MEESLLPPAHSSKDRSSRTKEIILRNNDGYATINDPQDFDIEEIKVGIKDGEMEDGGTIEIWQQREAAERARMRPLLTYCAISFWSVWTFSGLIHFLLTGNAFLIVTSPPLAFFLHRIFKYYFR